MAVTQGWTSDSWMRRPVRPTPPPPPRPMPQQTPAQYGGQTQPAGRQTPIVPADYGVPRQPLTTQTQPTTGGGHSGGGGRSGGGGGGVPSTGGIPPAPRGIDLGPFQSFEQWYREYTQVHGRPPTLEGWYDEYGRYHESALDEFQDSVNFWRQYGRGPTQREWINRYYTGSWFGYGGGWGGGGGGGGGRSGYIPSVPQPYYYPIGMYNWRW